MKIVTDTSPSATIVWFRQDLRLTDNPALLEAANSKGPVIPVYIWDDSAAKAWIPGGASRWWLNRSLACLKQRLRDIGSDLVVRTGRAEVVMEELVRETSAAAVVWNRCYEPHAISTAMAVKKSLDSLGVVGKSFNGALLFEPWTVKTGKDDPYRVFTPFWRACLQLSEPLESESAPNSLPTPPFWPEGISIGDLPLLSGSVDWWHKLDAHWTPGEVGGQKRLDGFVERAMPAYKDDRDRPDLLGTSRLSPHLHWGEVSPRQVWHTISVALRKQRDPGSSPGSQAFLREIGWREFSYHLLYHFPLLPEQNFQDKFEALSWREDEDQLQTWQRGATGIPIVDAGMRQLWQTGWMHNRVRMVVASFLTKNLMQHWREGAAWFWDTLVDADLANNSASWQWVAGSGADAAPYFRIFNPVLQGRKFDPQGTYVRTWVPELGGLPDTFIHRPWELSEVELGDYGVVLGETYPRPIVDLRVTRQRALEAYNEISR